MISPKIDIIIPTFKSKDITLLALKSFLKFNDYFNFKYIVVENSNDESYKNDVLSLSDDITWIQNPISEVGSFANANGLHKGLDSSSGDFVFLCHNDVMAVNNDWMKFLFDKIDKGGYSVVGFRRDPGRINAIHASGILAERKLSKSLSLYPVGNGSYMDVTDSLTKYCVDNGLNHYSCRNTFKLTSLESDLKYPFGDLQNIDRAVSDDGVVLYLHMGRGTPKTHKTYQKPNRIGVKEWIELGGSLL